jgi:hypothetical protein
MPGKAASKKAQFKPHGFGVALVSPPDRSQLTVRTASLDLVRGVGRKFAPIFFLCSLCFFASSGLRPSSV